MYDWNALWHQHAGYRTGFGAAAAAAGKKDVNTLADDLSARLIKPARHEHDVAVYEDDQQFIIAGHQNGLQLLQLKKHELFDITVHFVTEGDDSECALPYVEVAVDNLATGEHGHWRAPVSRDKRGDIHVGNRLLDEGLMPSMPFDALSFTDNSRFRDALYETWGKDLPALAPEIEAWFDPAQRQLAGAAAQTAAQSAGQTEASAAMPVDDARSLQMLERYAEIIRREQLLLSRHFSDAELQLIAAVLAGVHFESAASCRGLWLAVETRILDEELDQQHEVDGEALLAKLKTLSFTQEVALIEALSPAT